MHDDRIRLNLSVSSRKLEFAEFIQPGNRLTFIMHFNNMIGIPCDASRGMQAEFIHGHMEPWQIIQFVEVCRAYMRVAQKITTEDITQPFAQVSSVRIPSEPTEAREMPTSL